MIFFVQDMNRQVAFYRDTLGLRLRSPQGMHDFSGVRWVELDTGSCTLALPAGGKGRIGEDAPRIVFWVADINAARNELLQRGVQLGQVRPAAPGIQVCDGVDPEGNKDRGCLRWASAGG